jgi:NAD(P)-dependent dehydrogenase (short-subunit alcohol dehydrogenase family)
MDLGLAGRASVVTGASRGIGRATARHLAAEGASVLLIARGAEDLEEALAECRAEEGQAEALALDVTGPDAGDRIVAACTEAFGGLDVLVNNAGTARWRDLDDVPEADWYAAWELNVMAPLRAMRAAAPGMADGGWGRIVNVSSTAGKRPSAQMPDARREDLEAAAPMGRLARPEEVARVVAFLASPKSEYITGAHVNVGGGWTF